MQGSSSRVCVKGLPKHLTEERMRDIFAEVGEITDVKIVRTPEGKSRLFGFVGFGSEAEAAAAVARLHNTFVDTSRIQVELARGVGDSSLPRPWSKYSEGSSRFQGKPGAAPTQQQPGAHQKEDRASKRQRQQSADKEKERDEKFAAFLKLAMPGKGQERKAMPWENVEEEEHDKKEPVAGEEMDDMAWLRAKQGLGKEEKGEGKKKKKEEAEKQPQDDNDIEEEAYLRGSLAARHAEQAAKIAETRRIFIRNLPGSIDEAGLREHCARFGTVTECLLPLTEGTKLPKGFALVTFAAPHEALQAFAGLDGQILAGKLLHALAADAPRGGGGGGGEAATSKGKGSSSFKKQRDLQMREQGAQQQHAGNALFVKTDTAAALTAEKLGLKKAELLSAEAKGSVAVRAALAEAEVIADAKRFLEEHGVVPEVLANADKSGEKSDSTFLVKNLPAGTGPEKLEQLFAPFGDLGRVLVVPGGSLGLVEFQRASEAQKAYRKTAFSNFGGAPLYLQWAPMKLFSRAFEFKERPVQAVAPTIEEAGEGDEGACTVFVKNLSFSTTREELAAHVGTEGVRAVTIVNKNGQSLGYGFIEFASRAAAVKAMKQLQGFKLDGHSLELMFSAKQESKGTKKKKKNKKREAAVATESSKLVVRNVPFEASKKELQELMGAYGALKSLRLPLKFDRSHRGYAFAEYQSKGEARKALEALESAHLYGRHLVVEYAKEEDEVTQVREKTAKKFKGGDE